MSSDRAEALHRNYAERARRAVYDAIPVREPHAHLYDLLARHVLRPAKALRPVLCMATCGALGGPVDDAVPAAAALELLHNAFLVHDDIQDGGATRSGQPALHREYDVPLALNAGDALAALATRQLGRALRDLSPRRAAAVAAEFDRLVQRTVEGQATELGWQRDRVLDLGMDDYVRMAVDKTAWYTAIAPVRIGAIIAGGPVEPGYGVAFGGRLGVMFQIANDIANHVAHFQGRLDPADSDIHAGKRTVLMIHLLERCPDDALPEVHGILGKDARSRDDAGRIFAHMARAQSLNHAVDCVTGLASAAAAEAERCFGHLPDSDDKELLMAMVPRTLEALTGIRPAAAASGRTRR